MKRRVCLFLAILVFAVLVAGCREEVNVNIVDGNGLFMVGYAKADISPSEPSPMLAHADSAGSLESFDGTLRAISVCITDKDNNALIILSVDLFGADEAVADAVRKAVSDKTGVPVDRILFHCTHNLSGPDPSNVSYLKKLTDTCVQIAQEAMADRKSAQMYTAFARTEELVYTSHYLLNDGSYVGSDLASIPTDAIIGHAGSADNLLQMVKFIRNGDKDVILLNWQGHADFADSDTTVASGGFPSVMRAVVEEALDCESVYIQGGGGNLSCNSLLSREAWDYRQYGKKLGSFAVETAEKFQSTEMGSLLVAKEFLNAQGEKDQTGVPLYAYCIGNIALAAVPFEVFDVNVIPVREAADFKITLYASCSNGYGGYLPNPEAFQYISREVAETNYPMGTAESVQFILRDMLKELFAESGNQVRMKGEGYKASAAKPKGDEYVYTNPRPGELTAYEPVENGFCRVELMVGTKKKIMLAASEDLAVEILEKTTMKLKFDASHVIVDVVS